MVKNLRVVNEEAKKAYIVVEEYTVGVCLSAKDIKGFKGGNVSIDHAWCTIKGNELFIKRLYIKGGAEKNSEGKFIDPDRKLLEHREVLDTLFKKVFTERLAIIPLEAFSNEDGLLKIKIGLCKKNPDYVKPEYKPRDYKNKPRKTFNRTFNKEKRAYEK